MYRRLPDLLEKVRETIVRKIPRVLRGRGVEDNLSVVYLPKTGFMLRCVGRALPPDIADELGECEFAFDKSSDEPELALAADFPLSRKEESKALGTLRITSPPRRAS